MAAEGVALAVIVDDFLDDNDVDEVERMLAEIAVAEIMELEEGEGLGEIGKYWVPVNVDINDYHNLGDPCFKLHFRMSRVVFERLSQLVENHLVATGKLKRRRRPFADIMLMVVWILATPDSFRSVSLRFGVSPGTLYLCYEYVIKALRQLSPQFISWPNEEERRQIKTSFQRATGFPGVVGCIDGTHIFITAPLTDAAQYRNRHHGYSINVQAVVDSSLLIRDLHVGEVGSMHDARVFRRSPLSQDLLQRRNRILPDEHLVGDGGYVLTDYMMIPFVNNGHLTAEQLNFNKKLSQSRVRVENAFAKAKGKWRRLKFLHARRPDIVVDHITASFVLHNFIILNGDAMIDEQELGRPIRNADVLGNEDFFEMDENELVGDQQLQAAQLRGAEKRGFIMDNLHDFVM
ncbi:hypothetical protein FOCC_FOCC001472 [Frankliniella occidentalis]|nr:hypothetical protein FOCC_FOCC001472 [Frankliniella occidentalis]